MTDKRTHELNDIDGNIVDYYFIIDNNNLQEAQKIKGLDLISNINQSTSKQKAYYYTGQLTNGQQPINGWINGDFVYTEDASKIYLWQVLNSVVNLIFNWDKAATEPPQREYVVDSPVLEGDPADPSYKEGDFLLYKDLLNKTILHYQVVNGLYSFIYEDNNINANDLNNNYITVNNGQGTGSHLFDQLVSDKIISLIHNRFTELSYNSANVVPSDSLSLNLATQSSFRISLDVGSITGNTLEIQILENGYEKSTFDPRRLQIINATGADLIISFIDVDVADGVNLTVPNNQTFDVVIDRLTTGSSVQELKILPSFNYNTFALKGEQDARLDAIEAVDTEQDVRLDAIEAVDTEQDARLNNLEADVLDLQCGINDCDYITWANGTPIVINAKSNNRPFVYFNTVSRLRDAAPFIADIILDFGDIATNKAISGEFVLYNSAASTSPISLNLTVTGSNVNANYSTINKPEYLPRTTNASNSPMLVRYSKSADVVTVEFVNKMQEPITSRNECHRVFNSPDLNNYIKAGSCSGNVDTLNADGLGASYINIPVGVNFFNIEVTENITGTSSVFLTQKLTDIVTGEIFFRSRNNTTWTEWVEVITDRNISNYSHIKGYKSIPSTASYNLNVYTEIAGRFKITASGNFTLNAIGTLAQMNKNANISQSFEFLIHNNSSGNISVSLNTSGMTGFDSVLKYLEVPVNSNFNKNIPAGSHGKFIITFNPNGSGVVITGEGGQIFSLI